VIAAVAVDDAVTGPFSAAVDSQNPHPSRMASLSGERLHLLLVDVEV
jgi:hypothetical protein